MPLFISKRCAFHDFNVFFLQSTDNLEDSTNNKNSIHNSLHSPLQYNHNNNHIDTLPTHTYATHRLPNFTEMMSSQTQKILQQNKHIPSNTNNNNINPNSSIYSNKSSKHQKASQSNQLISSDTVLNSSSIEQVNERTVKTPLVVHGTDCWVSVDTASEKQDDNGNNSQLIVNDPLIDRFIAKNPNLTFKGDSEDIMNMDIIFDNVSIEEDDTIHGNVNQSSSVNDTNSSNDTIDITNVPESQISRVNIDGVQYEIITLNNAGDQENSSNENNVSIDSNDANAINMEPEENLQTETIVPDNIVDSSHSSVVQNEFDQYVYNENGDVLMSVSTLDVAAEIEATDQTVKVSESDEVTWPDKNETDIDITTSINVPEHSEDAPSVIEETELQTEEKLIIVPNQNENSIGNIQETKEPQLKLKSDVENDKWSESKQVKGANDKPMTKFPMTKRKQKPLPHLIGRNKRLRPNAGEKTVINAPTKKNDRKIDNVAEQSSMQSINALKATSNTNDKGQHLGESEVITNGSSNEESQIDCEATCETQELLKHTDQPHDSEAVDGGSENDESSQKTNFMDSLVVVESQDPNDSNKTIHEVYVMCPETRKMSDKPLDLPDDVIQQIRMSLASD